MLGRSECKLLCNIQRTCLKHVKQNSFDLLKLWLVCWCSAARGRIYLPQDELAQAGVSDEDIFAGKVTDKWRSFMKNQIKRARMFFQKAEKGVTELNQASRWPVRFEA